MGEIRIADVVEFVLEYGTVIPGLVEDIARYADGTVVYSVRSPYTGTLYCRESDEVFPMSPEGVAKVLGDMELLGVANPVNAALEAKEPAAWTFQGYGRWTRGHREVTEVGPSLYRAHLNRTHLGHLSLVDGTVYGKVSEARDAADRLRWTDHLVVTS